MWWKINSQSCWSLCVRLPILFFFFFFFHQRSLDEETVRMYCSSDTLDNVATLNWPFSFLFQWNTCGKQRHMWKKAHRCLRSAGRRPLLSPLVSAVLTSISPAPLRCPYRATADTSPSKCATSPAVWLSLTQKTGTAYHAFNILTIGSLQTCGNALWQVKVQ